MTSPGLGERPVGDGDVPALFLLDAHACLAELHGPGDTMVRICRACTSMACGPLLLAARFSASLGALIDFVTSGVAHVSAEARRGLRAHRDRRRPSPFCRRTGPVEVCDSARATRPGPVAGTP